MKPINAVWSLLDEPCVQTCGSAYFVVVIKWKVSKKKIPTFNLSELFIPLLTFSTMTISELLPHFEMNACHPGCLIVLFFSVSSPTCEWKSLHNSHIPWGWPTLRVCDETELKPVQICSESRLRLVYEAWN